MSTFPQETEVVVIGGGAIGCSTLYHLAKFGCKDVVLLERAKLTSGTTWHSAAQVRQLRSTRNLTELIKYSAWLYQNLEAETGQATGWRQTGSLSIADNPDRMTHVLRQASLANLFGVAAEQVDPTEIGRLWPLVRTDDLVGGVFAAEDGRVNPSDLCAALIKGAKANGARVFEDTPVTGITRRNGRIASVETKHGAIACRAVVDCAGLWGREVARMAGVDAPLQACEHFYLLTKPIDGITPTIPTLGNHDGHLYIREEVGGLLVGCFEPNARPVGLDKLPKDFAFDLLNEDWDHFEPMMMNALHRIPALETAEARMLLNGPESFTPDGALLLGEAPETPGFFLACGLNSMGVASAGGVGKAIAEWVIAGEAPMDLWSVDIRRFSGFHNNLRLLMERAPEELAAHYAIGYPGRELETARNVRRGPLHDRHAAKGAHFSQRAGWERPAWFANGHAVDTTLTYGRSGWFDRVAAEHQAAREGVALFDMSSYSKFLLQGPNAERLLQRLCANDMAVAPGRVVYTGMLNDKGGYEADVAVLRLAEDSYQIISGTDQATRTADWIRRNTADEFAILTDVTSAYATIGVMGPKARELMSRVSPDDFSNEAFRYFRHREIEVGYGIARAARLSYVGELGWELLIPTEFAAGVHDALCEAGADLGLVDAGVLAMTSLRIEKGYRAWGHELTPEDTPYEAGLDFAVKPGKQANFIGRDAVLRLRDSVPDRRLVMLTLEDADAMPIGGEPILHDGQMVGQVTSCAFGHTVGRAVAMGYVRSSGAAVDDMLAAGGFALEIARERHPATASLQAPYDPEGKRLRI